MTKSTSTAGRSKAKPNVNVTYIASARKPKSVGAEASSPATEQPAIGEPAVIVFGKDEGGKPHASWFTEADAGASDQSGRPDELFGFAGHLARHTRPGPGAARRADLCLGQGFLAVCKKATYEALSGFGEAFQPSVAEPTPVPTATGTPSRWTDIVVGALVLATSEQPADGWFESVVVEDRGEGLFVLRWRDWPDLDAFVRRSDGLALLPTQPSETSAEPHPST